MHTQILIIGIWFVILANASMSNELREVQVPSITNEQCAVKFGSLITEKQLCVDTKGGHSSCFVSNHLNWDTQDKVEKN